MNRALFLDFTSALVELWGHIPSLEGDFGLSYTEFVEQLEEATYTVRIAAVHLHIGSRSRMTIMKDQQFDDVIMLEDEPDYARLIAPIEILFDSPPTFMAEKEIGYVEVGALLNDDTYKARVFPATLHLASSFSSMQVETMYEDAFTQLLPTKKTPKKPHVCRQRWVAR